MNTKFDMVEDMTSVVISRTFSLNNLRFNFPNSTALVNSNSIVFKFSSISDVLIGYLKIPYLQPYATR